MSINNDFKIYDGEEYFKQVDKKINFEENDNNEIDLSQYYHINKILSLEVAIWSVRDMSGGFGCQVDNLVEMRKSLIDAYEKRYNESYVEYNEYYG